MAFVDLSPLEKEMQAMRKQMQRLEELLIMLVVHEAQKTSVMSVKEQIVQIKKHLDSI